MGVWIEIANKPTVTFVLNVTPCVGVWIEILNATAKPLRNTVTPCVGVWIEIRYPNLCQ